MSLYPSLRKSGLPITQIILLSCLFPAFMHAQSGPLKLSSREVDFGKIASVSQVPRTLRFTNTSSENLAILIIEKGPNVKAGFERKFFGPGEEGIIALNYEPRNAGSFQESLFIYTNLDEDPYEISLKGNVVSITECFPDPRNLLKRTIQVIDYYSKIPVPGAQVQLVHNHKFNNIMKVRVDKKGEAVEELPIGLYHITANAEKYEELLTEIYVPKSQPFLILEMKPEKTVPPPLPHPSPLEALADDQNVEEEISVPSGPVVTSRELPEDKYAANNLIFLLDVSNSMKSGKKFLLLQQSVNNLAMILRPIDNVSIITYSTEAHIVLTEAHGDEKERILNTVQDLKPYGITRGVKGLNTAYELANDNFLKRGNNQIILMTDGQFSEQGLSDEFYENLLGRHAAEGIKLSILGFGVNREAIDRMKRMCRAGNGSFILVESGDYIKDVLIEEVKEKSFMGD